MMSLTDRTSTRQAAVDIGKLPKLLAVSATVRQSVTPPAPVTGSHNWKIISPTPQSRRGKLVSVLDRFKPTIEPIWLVYPQTRHLTPTVRALVDFMAAQFRTSGQTKSPVRDRA